MDILEDVSVKASTDAGSNFEGIDCISGLSMTGRLGIWKYDDAKTKTHTHALNYRNEPHTMDIIFLETMAPTSSLSPLVS